MGRVRPAKTVSQRPCRGCTLLWSAWLQHQPCKQLDGLHRSFLNPDAQDARQLHWLTVASTPAHAPMGQVSLGAKPCSQYPQARNADSVSRKTKCINAILGTPPGHD